MSFLKGSIPLTVYKASPELLANITSDRLRQFAFQPIDEIAEEKSWGFVNHDDMFDTEWVKSVPEKGQYVVFGFRIDSRKIPASILKKHIAAMMADELEAMEAQRKKFILFPFFPLVPYNSRSGLDVTASELRTVICGLPLSPPCQE